MQLNAAQKGIITKRNKAFNRMSRADKIRAIAKDALAQIKKKNINAQNGDWINMPRDIVNGEPFIKDEESIQNIMLFEEAIHCKCCALGGIDDWNGL